MTIDEMALVVREMPVRLGQDGGLQEQMWRFCEGGKPINDAITVGVDYAATQGKILSRDAVVEEVDALVRMRLLVREVVNVTPDPDHPEITVEVPHYFRAWQGNKA